VTLDGNKMKRVHIIMRAAYADFRQYGLFYSTMGIACPLLYIALVWLESWGNTP